MNRYFILPFILSIVGLVNLILMRHTVAAIQMSLPNASVGTLDFILSTVSLLLNLPTFYTLYKLSHETENVAERQQNQKN